MNRTTGRISLKIIVREDLVSKDGKARIEFLLYFNRKQHRIASGKRVTPKYWIAKQECVDKREEDAIEINQVLNDRLSKFNNYIQTKKVLVQEPDLNEIKAILKGQDLIPMITKEKENTPLDISSVFKLFLDESQPKRAGTITNYIMTKNVLYDFCIKKYGREINIDEINHSFLNNLQKFLRAGREKPNNKNTIAKRLKILNTILRFAVDNEYLDKNPMHNYKIVHGEPREVALTESEYKNFRMSKLPQDTSGILRLTKYLFIFCCETGLRFSDMQDLKWDNISPDFKSLQKRQIKTSQDVYVPLSSRAQAMLIIYRKKYQNPNGYIFPRIDNQVMNRCLKDLAKISGINKCLTTHVARHTFGTRLGATGMVSAFTISELMGHKDIGMTQRYINLSKTDLNETMSRVWEHRNNIKKSV